MAIRVGFIERGVGWDEVMGGGTGVVRGGSRLLSGGYWELGITSAWEGSDS